jgi:hypothetical protein
MRRISTTLTAVAVAALLTASTAAAQGVIANRETNVTFSGPVSLPGTTLPAGTYVFRLADSPVNRHIVQIFEKDRAKLITTILAVAAERNQPEGDPVVSFKETPSDRPPAVRYWYYAGEKSGSEFIYPRAQAMMIAAASGESVTSFDTDSTDLDMWKRGEVTKVAPATTTEPSSTASTTSTATASTTSTTSTATTTTAPAATQPTASTTSAAPTTEPMPATTTAPTPATAPVMTQPEPTPATTTAPSTVVSEPSPVGTSGRTELPATASQLPMVGLIGLVAFAAALGIRAARRSIV